ncbi:MAG: hypothetical protein KJ077_42025 [Anaerolineae bacterium]|nr:hypothetical protein [Anaerolineae bacterium]
MTTELTEVQRTALGDCIAYLLERLRHQKAATASQDPWMHNPPMAAESLQTANREDFTPLTTPEQMETHPGTIA